METLQLEAKYRSDQTKRHRNEIRKQGYVTGSVFGRDSEPVPIELKLEDFAQQAKQAEAGIKTLIEMKILDAPQQADGLVVLKKFDKHPLTRKVLDMQFQRINLKEKISVYVPIVLVGEAVGLADGGIMDQTLDELYVSCLPTDIPPRIEIDVTHLGAGEHIRVEDIQLSEDITILPDPDTLVCSCAVPTVHAEPAIEEEEAEEHAAEAKAEATTESE